MCDMRLGFGVGQGFCGWQVHDGERVAARVSIITFTFQFWLRNLCQYWWTNSKIINGCMTCDLMD